MNLAATIAAILLRLTDTGRNGCKNVGKLHKNAPRNPNQSRFLSLRKLEELGNLR